MIKKILTTTILSGLVPVIAYGQNNPIIQNNQGRSLGGLVDVVVSLMNSAVALLAAAALLVFFWGLVKFIYAAGDGGEHLKGRQLMMWGIIIFFVMGSLWGIIGFIAGSVFSI